MSLSILTTKLYAPPPRPGAVRRSHLLQRLASGTDRPLTLVSAPAGFGKTTLVSDWVTAQQRPLAWLSLDESDGDLSRFLVYVISALQGVSPPLGQGVLSALQGQSSPPMEHLMTALINDIDRQPEPIILVLDDYHRLESQSVDAALMFLLEHMPRALRLVLVTREDPPLPLGRLRARGQLMELRAADLRFNDREAAEFLNRCMGLTLTEADIATLDARTEGWVAGLQLAAISMQDTDDPARLIQAFNGSHQFVLDYLLEEVLNRQDPDTQAFLLRTALLDRFCAELCDACQEASEPRARAVLDALEQANLFLIPLDTERRWYRYHHLFSDLLRQRLRQVASPDVVAEWHKKASQWLHDHDWPLEAFQQAVASGDIDLATQRLLGDTMPLHLRGEIIPVLDWLDSLSVEVKNRRPVLWVMHASALMMLGRLASIPPKLEAAEIALAHYPECPETDNLHGHIAANRAFLAVSRHDVDSMRVQSQRALALLDAHNLPARTAAQWALGHAHALSGDRAEARKAHSEALAVSQSIGHRIITIVSTTGLGHLHWLDNEPQAAAETYERLLDQAGDPPLPIYSEAHLGLTRIYYEWNDLDRAAHHLDRALKLADQYEHLDRTVACDWQKARLAQARHDTEGALTLLTRTRQFARQQAFPYHIPDLINEECRLRLSQGDVATAAELITDDAPVDSRARLALAREDGEKALALLKPALDEAVSREWTDRQLDLLLLQAQAYEVLGRTDDTLATLRKALPLAEPGGFIRRFLDEGPTLARLLARAQSQGLDTDYVRRLLAAFHEATPTSAPNHSALVDPLSKRELMVLELISEGLSNQAISERLFLALSTVKGHNQRIFDKLGVKRRTEAVARARELGLFR
ncbi:LuxR C-terminal-related transcriptional regulator [Saccharospirillum salsuginis]|uniref:Helix-turn-helix transcriptional regulator n=1 Tax=Saccharospirillum salsuginis TaxID=418750 RepID=A0A918KVE9_9GAMM|nr:LuxR C-terminal-related transcriptional regulator [Saccharospirillum salsuginis]GGX75070.1 helix-turn-helix transcriptional regulator [Saccharospirillum salsuginis]